MASAPPAPITPAITAILATKLFLPVQRPGAVARKRLLMRLERGLAGKLTLVSAPPGFGKTTLLAAWLAELTDRERPIAWVSLDEGDNDLATFWTYVISAMQRVVPGAGAGALSLLEAPPLPPVQSILGPLINELASTGAPLVLALDDFHAVQAVEIHDSLAYLLDHLPPGMHVVIASRADPLLPLSRLRVRGELNEVRAADLRFTSDEAATFLNDSMALDLPAQHISALESRTEGWIAALQLAALSMQGRDDAASFIDAFTGNDRYIVDYLVDEVLQRQPENVRRFLLQTSILDRLSAPLCDAVTGQEGGKGILESLERGNLFVVPLDASRQWFRYHHLFADVLRAHLLELQDMDAQELHRRASRWFERNGERPNAVRHSLAAGDFSEAARIVEHDAEAIVQSHRTDRLIEWLKQIPDEILRASPLLCAYYGHALQGIGDMEGSAARLDDAERGLRLAEDSALIGEETLRLLRTRISIGRGYLAAASGNVEATITYAREVLSLISPEEVHWRGTSAGLLSMALWSRGELTEAQVQHAEGLRCFEREGDTGLAITSAYHEADILKARGLLSAAEAQYNHSLSFAKAAGAAAMRMAANLYIGLSELCCERNDLDGAAHNLKQADELGIFPPRTPFRYCLANARLQQSRGDLEAAVQHLEEAERLQVRGAVPDFRPVAAWKARLWTWQGRLDEAAGWVRSRNLAPGDELAYLREYGHITLARLLIARYRTDRSDEDIEGALSLLGRLEVAAESGGRNAAVLEITVLRGLALAARGEKRLALEAIDSALRLGEPEGYARIFLDEGSPMRDLLAQAVGASVGGAYARRLLTALGPGEGLASPSGRPAAVSVPGLAEPLTPRELEILAFVAAGMQNQDIADHLVISLATVKRHIANAYGKLGVGHRTAAVARASELGLL